MQARQDKLDAWNLFLRVLVDRHAAAVVTHLERTIFEDGYVDFLAVTRKRFVDRVVDDLMRQVVRSRGIRVHARTTPNRFESAEDFNVRSIVSLSHSIL